MSGTTGERTHFNPMFEIGTCVPMDVGFGFAWLFSSLLKTAATRQKLRLRAIEMAKRDLGGWSSRSRN
jgi:hypothetical protein